MCRMILNLKHSPNTKWCYARLTCQPATRPTGWAKRGPEGLHSNTNWMQAGGAGECYAAMNTKTNDIQKYLKISLAD